MSPVKLDSMCELLLTVLALSQEGYNGPLSHAIPKRLMTALRKARKSDLAYNDDYGIYLEEMGTLYLSDAGIEGVPFTVKK
ncbi:MAG: hypothetical protein EPN91_03585 [Salinibacterium sp.]|nr:MAG: hypothetical protein EPN91_03585 [Salinibacterium sp.]